MVDSISLTAVSGFISNILCLTIAYPIGMQPSAKAILVNLGTSIFIRGGIISETIAKTKGMKNLKISIMSGPF